MKDNDLSALIFELQRARSPAEKARALARAWRTVRGLKTAERQLLAREVGFDGAEELIEGLADKGGGVFAPAAVLEALGKMRRSEGLSVRSVLGALRDPERRDDLLVRGMDLVVDALDGTEDDVDVPVWSDGSVELEVPASRPAPATNTGESDVEDFDDGRGPLPADEFERVAETPLPPLPAKGADAGFPPEPDSLVVEPGLDPDSDLGPEPKVEDADPSQWDKMWQESKTVTNAPITATSVNRNWISSEEPQAGRLSDSVLLRLRKFRDGIAGLQSAGSAEVVKALETLPESWAKRRAVVALIESGIPDDAASTLDLIEELDRPMDRRWCLSALARRGDLEGDALERALEMLVSPAAKRRVKAQADVVR